MGAGVARPRHRRRDVFRARGRLDRDVDLREERAPRCKACGAGQLLRRRLDARATARARGARATAQARRWKTGRHSSSSPISSPPPTPSSRRTSGTCGCRCTAGRRCAARTSPRRFPFERERRARRRLRFRHRRAHGRPRDRCASLPHESIIYFGDTARVPYGPKSPETVQRYSREIADLLVGRA